jgi:hypothetical protein
LGRTTDEIQNPVARFVSAFQVVGDCTWVFVWLHKVNSQPYIMPKRLGVDFKAYPWSQHAKDLGIGTCELLKTLGFWLHADTAVKGLGVAHLGATPLERNLRELAKAVEGAERIHMLPDGFSVSAVPARMAEGNYFYLTAPELAIDGTVDSMSSVLSSMPQGPEQFFSLDANSNECVPEKKERDCRIESVADAAFQGRGCSAPLPTVVRSIIEPTTVGSAAEHPGVHQQRRKRTFNASHSRVQCFWYPLFTLEENRQMSTFIQTRGEFLWVFTRGHADELTVHKVFNLYLRPKNANCRTTCLCTFCPPPPIPLPPDTIC